jgi:ThiF family
MSRQLISRSADLQRLREEGYDVEIRSAHLLVKHVPYVTQEKEVKFGVLISTLNLAGDTTARPETHVAFFAGETPCNADGTPLNQLIIGGAHQLAADVSANFQFSSKPVGTNGYVDYHEKMSAYVNMLGAPAAAIDPAATAKTFPVIEDDDPDSPFNYVDNASARAGIAVIAEKLQLGRIAIVGLGGTGSYILDLVAKTPVREIHLFDGDALEQHNAFRAPGAPSLEQLQAKPPKVEHLAAQYTPMRTGIFTHPEYINAANVDELREMAFVFVAIDAGAAKRLVIDNLDEYGIPFVDVGMGVYEADGALGGQLRTTASTPAMREHVAARISFADGAEDEDDYHQNIQIAELNALNAALAVIRWKKLFGFYADFGREHNSVYTIVDNFLVNDDHG